MSVLGDEEGAVEVLMAMRFRKLMNGSAGARVNALTTTVPRLWLKLGSAER